MYRPMHTTRRHRQPHGAAALAHVDTDATQVDLSGPGRRRNSPVVLVSHLIQARVIGTVPAGEESREVVRRALDHLDLHADDDGGRWGRVDVAGLGVVHMSLERTPDAIVITVLAESEVTRARAGHLRIGRTEYVTVYQLYGVAPPRDGVQ